MKSGEVKIRVIYADTDAMGIVYHASYIRWFEVGRTELCREMGIVNSKFESSLYHLPLTKISCHYLMPARYDDLVVVETIITGIKRASIAFGYRILDERKERTLVRGTSLHACTNGSGKVVRIPKTFIDKINRAEGE